MSVGEEEKWESDGEHSTYDTLGQGSISRYCTRRRVDAPEAHDQKPTRSVFPTPVTLTQKLRHQAEDTPRGYQDGSPHGRKTTETNLKSRLTKQFSLRLDTSTVVWSVESDRNTEPGSHATAVGLRQSNEL